ncbi:uncharacterized protein LOC143293577 isoform X3 [Babylonia areolata]|uniref:uncharacterized protein LOC143293577 isoform X3 n=1 Tax=Babylonia areolata TaxID=304850 RepID=UPI003FD57FE1
MDEESSTKFMGSLTKFLQSLCNGYVEFEDGVELIGHIYLSVDAGKTGKKLNYFLNEKVCKNDNSVTFISNSFHAQPEGKAKGQSGKDGEGKKDDEVSETSESVPKSTNAGTVPLRTPMSSRSAPSPNQSRSGVQTGTKRPGSPLSAPTPPSQRRMQSSVKSSVGSPVSKTVPSSPSSSSQDNIPSPSPARKNRSEISQPPSNQSDNASIDNESDIVPSNIMTINPPPDFASFIGSLTSDNQTSRDQRSPPDMKPDTDVTFIKEEFVSEPSSCAQTGSSGQSGRSGDDLYPVMLHQNTSVFPSTSSAYPSATATSQHPGFPGASTSQSDPFNPQDGADPSVPVVTAGSSSLEPGSELIGTHANKIGGPSVLMGDRRPAGPLPPFFSLAHPSPFLTSPIRSKLLGSVPSIVSLPSALGFMSDMTSTIPVRVEGGVCKLCRRHFPGNLEYQAHVRTCRKGMISCDYCDMAFARRFNLKVHLRCRHGIGEQLTCSYCGITFRSKVRLETHRCSARGNKM